MIPVAEVRVEVLVLSDELHAQGPRDEEAKSGADN